ncbi:heat shock factor protein 2 [Thalassophryne amazonica]|uniref:heat shock factor protein 2 n=1 Tax=Thalassophryne amazonica TaxID=390379 RepID=UPI0014715DD1|nr:heat shock factor protein 2 [Thalassophryne amazonica]
MFSRENETLWREISDLRQKHVHQQQLIKKLIQFIVTLVQNNHILNLKRKRPILMNSSGKKPKYIHQLYEDKVCVDQSPVNGLNPVKNSDVSDDVIICDLSESDAEVLSEVTETSSRSCEQGDAGIVEVDLDSCTVLPAEMEVSTSCIEDARPTDTQKIHVSESSGATTSSSALQLNKTSSLSLEDPLKMMDSILKENGAVSQNINLLGKVELMDYLDSIDCSLEDFQAMVYGKQFGIDCDALEETVSPKDHEIHLNREKTDDDNTDKQLIQYTTCPLMAFLDGCTLTPELDPGTGGTELCGTSEEAEPALELLDSGLESKQVTHSSLIRLEPLTEAEASEETLFYLCELNPDESESNPQ